MLACACCTSKNQPELVRIYIHPFVTHWDGKQYGYSSAVYTCTACATDIANGNVDTIVSRSGKHIYPFTGETQEDIANFVKEIIEHRIP